MLSRAADTIADLRLQPDAQLAAVKVLTEWERHAVPLPWAIEAHAPGLKTSADSPFPGDSNPHVDTVICTDVPTAMWCAAFGFNVAMFTEHVGKGDIPRPPAALRACGRFTTASDGFGWDFVCPVPRQPMSDPKGPKRTLMGQIRHSDLNVSEVWDGGPYPFVVSRTALTADPGAPATLASVRVKVLVIDDTVTSVGRCVVVPWMRPIHREPQPSVSPTASSFVNTRPWDATVMVLAADEVLKCAVVGRADLPDLAADCGISFPTDIDTPIKALGTCLAVIRRRLGWKPGTYKFSTFKSSPLSESRLDPDLSPDELDALLSVEMVFFQMIQVLLMIGDSSPPPSVATEWYCLPFIVDRVCTAGCSPAAIKGLRGASTVSLNIIADLATVAITSAQPDKTTAHSKALIRRYDRAVTNHRVAVFAMRSGKKYDPGMTNAALALSWLCLRSDRAPVTSFSTAAAIVMATYSMFPFYPGDPVHFTDDLLRPQRPVGSRLLPRARAALHKVLEKVEVPKVDLRTIIRSLLSSLHPNRSGGVPYPVLRGKVQTAPVKRTSEDGAPNARVATVPATDGGTAAPERASPAWARLGGINGLVLSRSSTGVLHASLSLEAGSRIPAGLVTTSESDDDDPDHVEERINAGAAVDYSAAADELAPHGVVEVRGHESPPVLFSLQGAARPTLLQARTVLPNGLASLPGYIPALSPLHPTNAAIIEAQVASYPEFAPGGRSATRRNVMSGVRLVRRDVMSLMRAVAAWAALKDDIPQDTLDVLVRTGTATLRVPESAGQIVRIVCDSSLNSEERGQAILQLGASLRSEAAGPMILNYWRSASDTRSFDIGLDELSDLSQMSAADLGRFGSALLTSRRPISCTMSRGRYASLAAVLLHLGGGAVDMSVLPAAAGAENYRTDNGRRLRAIQSLSNRSSYLAIAKDWLVEGLRRSDVLLPAHYGGQREVVEQMSHLCNAIGSLSSAQSRGGATFAFDASNMQGSVIADLAREIARVLFFKADPATRALLCTVADLQLSPTGDLKYIHKDSDHVHASLAALAVSLNADVCDPNGLSVDFVPQSLAEHAALAEYARYNLFERAFAMSCDGTILLRGSRKALNPELMNYTQKIDVSLNSFFLASGSVFTSILNNVRCAAFLLDFTETVSNEARALVTTMAGDDSIVVFEKTVACKMGTIEFEDYLYDTAVGIAGAHGLDTNMAATVAGPSGIFLRHALWHGFYIPPTGTLMKFSSEEKPGSWGPAWQWLAAARSKHMTALRAGVSELSCLAFWPGSWRATPAVVTSGDSSLKPYSPPEIVKPVPEFTAPVARANQTLGSGFGLQYVAPISHDHYATEHIKNTLAEAQALLHAYRHLSKEHRETSGNGRGVTIASPTLSARFSLHSSVSLSEQRLSPAISEARAAHFASLSASAPGGPRFNSVDDTAANNAKYGLVTFTKGSKSSHRVLHVRPNWRIVRAALLGSADWPMLVARGMLRDFEVVGAACLAMSPVPDVPKRTPPGLCRFVDDSAVPLGGLIRFNTLPGEWFAASVPQLTSTLFPPFYGTEVKRHGAAFLRAIRDWGAEVEPPSVFRSTLVDYFATVDFAITTEPPAEDDPLDVVAAQESAGSFLRDFALRAASHGPWIQAEWAMSTPRAPIQNLNAQGLATVLSGCFLAEWGLCDVSAATAHNVFAFGGGLSVKHKVSAGRWLGPCKKIVTSMINHGMASKADLLSFSGLLAGSMLLLPVGGSHPTPEAVFRFFIEASSSAVRHVSALYRIPFGITI